MPTYGYAILAAGFLLWVMPFLLAKRKSRPAPVQVDRRARWGILLLAVAYSLLWTNDYWRRPLPFWRPALSCSFFLLAALLSWSSVRALGRQWRVEAGLNADHELITSGPYRLVRHPIYASLLCLLLALGFLVTPLPLLPIALLFGVAGTEVRVRIEDKLLASRFGDRFERYRRATPAYLPFIR